MAMDAAHADEAEGGASSLLLHRVEPYWHEYRTNCKMRWAGRPLLEVFVTEFRDRTSHYYQWAIHRGFCRVNDTKASPDYILKMNDQMQHKLHRHEAPVTAEPIRILYRDDKEGRLVVVKPGSIPVHPAGRHFKTTLVEMLRHDHGIPKVYTSNRLDRLTSGIMVCSTKKEPAHKLAEQFAMGKVRKAYVCRVRGAFPAGETLVEEPLLIADRQSGVSIVHPLGKYSATIFTYMWYDPETDTTAVYCRPITGRTHQIRIHAQWLGHPISNDPIYASPMWEKYPQQMLKTLDLKPDRWKIDPGSTLSVYGAQEVDDLIAGLKVDKDDREDWARWRDEVMFGQMLKDEGLDLQSVPGPNGESAAEQRQQAGKDEAEETLRLSDQHKGHFCDECQVPLIPDPKPEELYIYLHAMKYQTDEWTYEDRLPWWARRDWRHPRKTSDDDGLGGFVLPSLDMLSMKDPETTENVFVQNRRPSKVPTDFRLEPLSPLLSYPETQAAAPRLSILSDQHPPVVLEMFGGLEDFAAQDVMMRLREAAVLTYDGHDIIDYTINTNHIFIKEGRHADATLQLYRHGHLNCVKAAFVQIAHLPMPQDILDGLSNEKQRNHKLIAQANHNRKKSKRGDSNANSVNGVDQTVDPGAVPSQPSALPRAETENRLIQAIESAWLQCSAPCQDAFAIWRSVTGFKSKPETEPLVEDSKPSFRASVDRTGYSMPTLTSVQLEKELGDIVWDWLNGESLSPDGDWAVDLENADLEVTLKLLAGPADLDIHWRTKDANAPGRFLFMIRIPQSSAAPHRPPIPNHLVHGGTALARYRSYLLATVLPVPDRMKDLHKDQETAEASPRVPLRIWEPCAGSGSFTVEIVASLERRGIPHEILISDICEEDTDKAKEMLRLCGISIAKIGALDATDADAAADYLGGDDTLDGIITDLPWGRRVLSHMSIAKLYPSLLHTFAQVLKPGGVALLMTADYRTLLRATKIHEADARRRDLPWRFSVEKIRLNAGSDTADASEADVLTDEQREGRVRIVHCGYMVGVVFLRKVALKP